MWATVEVIYCILYGPVVHYKSRHACWAARGIIARAVAESKGKARNITVLSARVLSRRKAEQTRREEVTTNIDETTTRPSSTDIDIGEEKKKVSTEDQ